MRSVMYANLCGAGTTLPQQLKVNNPKVKDNRLQSLPGSVVLDSFPGFVLSRVRTRLNNTISSPRHACGNEYAYNCVVSASVSLTIYLSNHVYLSHWLFHYLSCAVLTHTHTRTAYFCTQTIPHNPTHSDSNNHKIVRNNKMYVILTIEI